MAFVLVVLFTLGNVVRAEHFKGAIQYRITESEINKVASALLSYGVDVRPSNQTVVLNNLVYELEQLQKHFSGEEVHIKIPVDGRVDAVVRFSSVHLTGKVRVIGSSDDDVKNNEKFDVTLTHVTLVSKYFLGQNVFKQDHRTLSFDTTNCSADIKAILASQESVQNIMSELTEDNQKKLFQNALCHSYTIQLNLGFGAFGVSFRIFQKPLLVTTKTCGLDVRNKRFLITQEVKTTNTDDTLLPACSADNMFLLPSMDAMGQPFEIVLNVKDTYPDAVGRMVVLDADIYIKVLDGSLQLNVDITSNMLITLNCDKSRTYSAFNFTMNLYFPAQIGFDSKYLTFKLFGFGGTFTVLNSTVGHIVDRATWGFLYAVPSYTNRIFGELNDYLKEGIPLTNFLPEGVSIEVKSLSLKKDCVVIGGGLTLIDPGLPLRKRSEITWVGKSFTSDDLYLLGLDRTPEELKPEEEKNCKEPEITSGASFITHLTYLMCIMSLVIYTC